MGNTEDTANDTIHGKKGRLLKQDPNSKHLCRYYAVLSGSKLSLYNHESSGKAIECVDLKEFQRVERCERGGDRAKRFKIIPKDEHSKVVTFIVSSGDDMDAWIEEIQRIVFHAPIEVWFHLIFVLIRSELCISCVSV